MASSDVLSQTLSSITSIKLEEISLQRANFEDAKAALLESVANEPDQREKVHILLNRVEKLASMSKLTDNSLMSLTNVKKFLEQARCDPSVSINLQKDWQAKIEKELDVHSLRYEYASLYGKLVKEWLSTADDNSDSKSSDGSYEEVGRKEMHDQREMWEDYVFKARETDANAIQKHLENLFKSNKEIEAAYYRLLSATEDFEKEMAKEVHFDDSSLKWVIRGLLRSDLVTDEKRKILKDFLNNSVVLGELADVLNMRMSSLDKWKWDPAGTPVEQRRKLNGRYRFYHDEDLLQTILVRYIAVKWSVHFKTVLTSFQSASGVWKASSTPVPASDRKRREYFLGPSHDSYRTVESQRASHFINDIFLEQMQHKIEEHRGGYDDDKEDENDTRKTSHKITEELLHMVAAEIIMKTRLGEEISIVRSDFKWFGPSLPHSTMLAVLKFFRASDRWISFFHRALEAPMKFIQDGPDAQVRIRKRGTPISGPLSDMLAETVLFCLDFSFNQLTDGARLYRLHDDIWFWGNDETCVKGWKVMTEFTELMGLELNEDKTGSVKITRRGVLHNRVADGLPKGDVSWGFLKLDSATGKFLIDQAIVDKHIEELGRQLGACKSVFDWIHAWNVYGVRFFTANFGLPAHCFGRSHVDSMLETFTRIQSKLFASTGGSVTATLKQILTDRFGVMDIPEGYLYFPMSMGGLDVKNPFIQLYLIRDGISTNPDTYMDTFFRQEESAYRDAKLNFDNDKVPGRRAYEFPELRSEPFMSFAEFTRYREQTSFQLRQAYTKMTHQPAESEVKKTNDVSAVLGEGAWRDLSPYQRWIMQLYAPDMIARFGGLTVVEKGLLPTGMVNMFRESRFKWQG
jgi:hypothetical protein